MIQYSIVIPVFNSVESLPVLVEEIQKVFPNNDFEIIFVNDGSDNPATWKTLYSLKEEFSFITVIDLMKNFGQQSATLCGINESIGTYVVTMDDDMQHHPEYIKLLLDKQKSE